MSDAPATSTRRQLLVGVVGATVVGAATWALLSYPTGESQAIALGSLRIGDAIGDATVIAIHPPHLGAVPIVLRAADGGMFQVDVLARDPQGPAGVAETARLSLFVANRGDGSTATDEAQGLAVMALAARLDGVEPGAELLTLRERAERYPTGSFAVPLS